LVADIVARFYDSNLEQHARGSLLDLGCGKVPLYVAYHSFVEKTTCVDWSNSLHENDFLDFEVDLTGVLPFQDGEFDTIILSDVLEHIPVPEHLWAEMSRILSENGKIVLNVPFCYWVHEEPHDFYRYTEFALRRYVADAGLKLNHLEPLGGAPEVLADILAKVLVGVPWIGRHLSVFVQWLTQVFLRTRIGRRCSARTMHRFPIGYGLIASKQ
jgi:SAM-dependent methyltransferase